MQMALRVFAVAAMLLLQHAAAASMESKVNPIRRVVKMLQSMQAKVEEEGEKEEELYKKYMCYCKTSGGDLGESIAAAETKVPELNASIEEGKASKAQLEQDIKDHKATREEALKSLDEAKALREKEAAEYAKIEEEANTNAKALAAAIAAIEKGMGSSFLETPSAKVFKRFITTSNQVGSFDREALVSFLAELQKGGTGYAPQSGEILGMLKEMMSQMDKDFAEAKAQEEEAKANYEELVAAKEKEIVASTKAIEEKSVRLGDLAVKVAEMSNDLEDTTEALAEDQKFLADLEKNCATKKSEWEEIEKLRNQELIAIAETIKILNDDDALELFKKTLPSPSLMQVTESSSTLRRKALKALHVARASHRPEVDFLALALSGKKVGFEKVIVLIDELVETLKKEQVDDDTAKEHCEKEFDVTEDKIKELEKEKSNIKAAIEDTKSDLETLAAEIKALKKTVKDLDKQVAESTETRKEEHAEYTELMASDAGAKDLLELAKNRLNKFYNPKLHKTTTTPKPSREAEIAANFGVTDPTTPAPMAFVQVHAHIASSSDSDAKPPPPPESFGPYAKKGEESNGVIAMVDMLIADLVKEMTVAEAEEKNAQAAYEEFMTDAKEKRAQDTKTITDKESAKAELEVELQNSKDSKKATNQELLSTGEYMQSLHTECDWLLKNFELRKSARAAEVDSLKSAKAVLSGADYSLVQQTRRVNRLLRGPSY